MGAACASVSPGHPEPSAAAQRAAESSAAEPSAKRRAQARQAYLLGRQSPPASAATDCTNSAILALPGAENSISAKLFADDDAGHRLPYSVPSDIVMDPTGMRLRDGTAEQIQQAQLWGNALFREAGDLRQKLFRTEQIRDEALQRAKAAEGWLAVYREPLERKLVEAEEALVKEKGARTAVEKELADCRARLATADRAVAENIRLRAWSDLNGGLPFQDKGWSLESVNVDVDPPSKCSAAAPWCF